MKRNIIIYSLLSCFAFIGISCNPSKDNKTVAIEETIEDKVATDPECVDKEQTHRDTFNLGNNRYIVQIHRFPDKNSPLLVDGLHNSYYDNSVEITIYKQQDIVQQKVISKNIFKEYLSEKEFKEDPLWGMNFYREKSTSSQLYFTAQVGWGGDGPAFFYILNLQNGDVRIEIDNTVQEVDYESNLNI